MFGSNLQQNYTHSCNGENSWAVATFTEAYPTLKLKYELCAIN